MRFTDLLEESRLAAEPLRTHTGIHGNQKNYISSFPGKPEIPRCWNAQIHCHYLAASYLTGLGFFSSSLPAVLIVQCVAYTCNLEIPHVTFPRQKLYIIFTWKVDAFLSVLLCKYSFHPWLVRCRSFTFLAYFQEIWSVLPLSWSNDSQYSYSRTLSIIHDTLHVLLLVFGLLVWIGGLVEAMTDRWLGIELRSTRLSPSAVILTTPGWLQKKRSEAFFKMTIQAHGNILR